MHNTRLLLKSYNGERPLSVFQHGLAGLAGGLTVSFVATPVEQIKARLQVQYNDGSRIYKGPIDCARQIAKNNGVFKGLWKGLLPTMAFRSWFFVFWASYEVRIVSRLYLRFGYTKKKNHGLYMFIDILFPKLSAAGLLSRIKKAWVLRWRRHIYCWWPQCKYFLAGMLSNR